MARQQRAAVLGAGAELDQRLEEVAHDAHRDQENDDQRQAGKAEAASDRRVDAGRAGCEPCVDRQPGSGDEQCPRHATPHAFPALARADRGCELAPAESAAAEIGEDVGSPDENEDGKNEVEADRLRVGERQPRGPERQQADRPTQRLGQRRPAGDTASKHPGTAQHPGGHRGPPGQWWCRRRPACEQRQRASSAEQHTERDGE